MLVLTRKTGERIVIAEVITLQVLGVQGNRVQIGIWAPRGVSICRQDRLTGQSSQRRSLEGPHHP
jgi:carbon storage regulator